MSPNYSFDYQFNICNCSFPDGDVHCTSGFCYPFATIYAQCTLPDPSGTREQKIRDKTEELLNIVSELSHLRNYASFITIDGYRYKIFIVNDEFTNFI